MIPRTPWGGRLVEGLGQDNYLNGVAFGLGTKAFAETGIIAGGKHFLLNEQETNRQSQGSSEIAPYSSVADDKTMHETYLWSFYDGAKVRIFFYSKCFKLRHYLWSFFALNTVSPPRKISKRKYILTLMISQNGMGAVMCAMTKVNESLSCENEILLQKLLKTELGFPGFVSGRRYTMNASY